MRRFSVTSFPEQPAETHLTELELRARAQEAVSRIVAECVSRPPGRHSPRSASRSGANAIVNLELGP